MDETPQKHGCALSADRKLGRVNPRSGWNCAQPPAFRRPLRDTNHLDEARAMLSGIYDWFTEGFDTADLKDAK